jgi:phosphate transport system protein
MESGHSRQALSVELQALEHDLLDMASRAESMVALAVDSLVKLNTNEAREVLEKDDEIDMLDFHIENQCLRLLALQQPMASDLRIIGTAIKMITDIERIGDLAVDVARITLKIQAEFGESSVIDIPRIANIARAMLRTSLQAFVKRDLDLVEQVIKQDDEVDALYRDLRGQLHTNMRQNPDLVVSDSWLLLAIHHVERIADHTVNMAERVAFMVTGQIDAKTKHQFRQN